MGMKRRLTCDVIRGLGIGLIDRQDHEDSQQYKGCYAAP
jgi:hypothetical protein